MTNLTRCRSHESIQRGVRAFLAGWNSNNGVRFVLSFVRWHFASPLGVCPTIGSQTTGRKEELELHFTPCRLWSRGHGHAPGHVPPSPPHTCPTKAVQTVQIQGHPSDPRDTHAHLLSPIISTSDRFSLKYKVQNGNSTPTDADSEPTTATPSIPIPNPAPVPDGSSDRRPAGTGGALGSSFAHRPVLDLLCRLPRFASPKTPTPTQPRGPTRLLLRLGEGHPRRLFSVSRMQQVAPLFP